MVDTVNGSRLFDVIIGDWAGDIQGQVRSFVVVIPDYYTDDMLKSNYESMVETLGFSLSDVADGYAEPYLSEARSEALAAAGFDVAGKLEREDDYFEEQYLITPDTMLDVVMFFFGLGNEGEKWRRLQTSGALVGGRNPLVPGSIGMGLYYT